MSILRVILVEDEFFGMDNFCFKLQNNCFEVEIVVECLNGVDVIKVIKWYFFDVLFLDILLGDMIGFDVLKVICYFFFEVIFIISYDQYVIEVIKNSVVDYLLKLVDIEELLDVVVKVCFKLFQQLVVSVLIVIVN